MGDLRGKKIENGNWKRWKMIRGRRNRKGGKGKWLRGGKGEKRKE